MFEAAVITIVTMLLVLSGTEVMLRLFHPQIVMFPRWEASPSYGVMLPRAVTMVHQRPGVWKFHYTINEDGCRGTRVPNNATSPVVVALGDSYTMGIGVNDGEEYPAILAKELGDNFCVLNCGSPGWGLPQEVRRFHEFALKFDPEIVILQFCANDPEDGQRDDVTRIENDSFVFQNTTRRNNPIFAALSTNRLAQGSQVYALVRGWYESRRDAHLERHVLRQRRAAPSPLALLVRRLPLATGLRALAAALADVVELLATLARATAPAVALALPRPRDVERVPLGLGQLSPPLGQRVGVRGSVTLGSPTAEEGALGLLHRDRLAEVLGEDLEGRPLVRRGHEPVLHRLEPDVEQLLGERELVVDLDVPERLKRSMLRVPATQIRANPRRS